MKTIILIKPNGKEKMVFIWCNEIIKADSKSILADGVRIEFPYKIKFFG